MQSENYNLVVDLCKDLYKKARLVNWLNLSYPVVSFDDERLIHSIRLEILAFFELKYPGMLEHDVDINKPYMEAVKAVDMEFMLEYKKRYPETYNTIRFWDAVEGNYMTKKEAAYLKSFEDKYVVYMGDMKNNNAPPYVVPML